MRLALQRLNHAKPRFTRVPDILSPKRAAFASLKAFWFVNVGFVRIIRSEEILRSSSLVTERVADNDFSSELKRFLDAILSQKAKRKFSIDW